MLIKRHKINKKRILHTDGILAINPQLEESEKIKKEIINKAKEAAELIKKEAEDVLKEAKEKVKKAEEQALHIIDSANIEASEIKDAIHQEALSEAEKIRTKCKSLLNELFEVKKKVLEEIHKEISDIALDLAAKIIKHKASIDPEVLKIQVTEAIKKSTAGAERIIVYVHPEDKEILEKLKGDIEKLFPLGTEISPQADDAIDQGSCKIETRSGQLDASFSTQLTALMSLASNVNIRDPQINIECVEESSECPDSKEFAEKSSAISDQSSENTKPKTEDKEPETETTKSAASIFTQFVGSTNYEPIEFIAQESTDGEIPQKSALESFLEATEASVEQMADSKQSMEYEDLLEDSSTESTETNFKSMNDPLDEIPIEDPRIGQRAKNGQDLEHENLLEDISNQILGPDDQILESSDQIDTSNILKPKKKNENNISSLVQEVEENPEWKGLIEEEE